MKRFVQGESRTQSTLLPESVDDDFSDTNPVRVVDVFVDELDLGRLGFEGVDPAKTGRPSYHPAVLLKIYIDGYLNRIQSSRRLEREAQRNVELMWLTGRLAPDFKTIANFVRTMAKPSAMCAGSSWCCASNWACSRTRWWRSTGASSRQSITATATSPAPS
jgi:transposase